MSAQRDGRWSMLSLLAGSALLLAAVSGRAAAGDAAPARNDWQPCLYWSGDGFNSAADCVRRHGRAVAIRPALLRRLPYAANDTAWLLVERQDYLVKRDGRALSVIHFDNGADDFSDGLVRSRVDGRIGYFDADFRQVIAPAFDFGWPFEDGRAEVCVGCRAGQTDADGHVPMLGGRWFTIDRAGNEIRK